MRNSDIEDILSDPNFFVEENKEVLVLKKDHRKGYFTNCQLQISLCGGSFCDIAAFVFKGMIKMRKYIKEDVFVELIDKTKSFYRKIFYLNLQKT